MGCDSYFLVTSNGVGFVVNYMQFEQYKQYLNDKYGAFMFVRRYHNEKIHLCFFIYDKETIMCRETTLDGSYDTNIEQETTQIYKHTKITNLIQPKLKNMAIDFHINDTCVSYYTIVSTFPVAKYACDYGIDDYLDEFNYSNVEIEETTDFDTNNNASDYTYVTKHIEKDKPYKPKIISGSVANKDV